MSANKHCSRPKKKKILKLTTWLLHKFQSRRGKVKGEKKKMQKEILLY